MTQWYSKVLGDGVEALAPTQAIQAAFLPLFAVCGQPINMAVFARYENGIDTVFFSPGAAVLAEKFGAQECEKPKRVNHLSLLVGDARCWELFYPGPQ